MHPEHVYIINPVVLSREAMTLPRDALRVAMLFDGHRRLWEVVRDSHLSSRMTMSVFGRLVSMDVIHTPTLDHTSWDAPIPASEPEGEVVYDAAAKPVSEAAPRNEEETVAAAAEEAIAPAMEDEACAATVRVDSAEIPALAPAEPFVKAPAAPPIATAPAPEPAFDATDETFFESYVPEDDSLDTFWDLEATPHARMRARKQQERGRSGGWFRQLLSMF